MKTWVIVNPASARGRGRGNYAGLEAALRQALGPFEVRFTAQRGDATRFSEEALRCGAERVIAVGGDGTFNEVLNGFRKEDGALSRQAALGCVSSGTACDFPRAIGLPSSPAGQVACLASSATRAIDVGKISFRDERGAPAVRFFLNTASFGLGGAVAQRVDRMNAVKWASGSAVYAIALVRAFFEYKAVGMGVRVDGTAIADSNLLLVAVCNGGFFGGKMHVAPGARVDDGALDVIVVTQARALRFLSNVWSVYRGRHLELPEVTHVRGQRIEIIPEADDAGMPIELDGESPGHLPATVDVLPGAIEVLC